MKNEQKFPISLDEFKLFFLREAGLEYQPFPTWMKTVWDKGDICQEGNMYYESLIDLNHIGPSEPVIPEETPIWKALTVEYTEDTAYEAGTIVFYNNQYWKAVENTETLPAPGPYWLNVIPCKEFPNSRVWAAPTAYNEGDKVIAIVNFRPGVWESMVDNNYTNPAVNPPIPDQDPEVLSWELSEDDTADMDDWILDLDILRAMGEATFKFNPTLFSKEKGKMIFLYLTMFFLVYDRQMASGGLNSSAGAGPVTHRTVGKMSVSYAESKLYSSYPSYEFLAGNDYGRKAFNLMLPYLRGGVRVLRGGSTGE